MNPQRYEFKVYALGLSLLATLTLFGFSRTSALLLSYLAFGIFFFIAALLKRDIAGSRKILESLALLILWPLVLPFFSRTRMADVESDEDEDPRLLDLITRFGGKIDATPDIDFDTAARMSVVFADLMEEWNPINFSVDDFSKIVGAPTRIEDGVLEYEFDNGWDGDLWRFEVSGPDISGVEHIAFD